MAQDGLISAMWHSLVPTFEHCEGAGNVESSTVVVDVKTYYAEAEQDHHLFQTYPDIEPMMDDWNTQEMMTMMMEDYRKRVEFLTEDEASAEMQQALSDSLEIKDIYCVGDQERAFDLSELEMIKATQYSSARPSAAPPKKIYRVPNTIRKANKDYYDPQYMSIGPYNYGDSDLEEAEWDKYTVYENLRERDRISFTAFKPVMQANEKKVRAYYGDLSPNPGDDGETKSKSSGHVRKAPEKKGAVSVSSEDLARCMFLDACSILAHLRILQWLSVTPASNSIAMELERPSSSFTRDGYRNIAIDPVIHDLCLMENQMPFFVIQKVYDLCKRKDNEQVPLRHQVVEYLQKTVLQPYPIAIAVDAKETDDFEHILHYCHMCFAPLPPTDESNHSIPIAGKDRESTEFNRWRRATDLYEKGIRFTVPREKAKFLLDIRYNEGELTIPTLTIDRYTTFLFANVLAFEQSSIPPNSSNQVNNYFSAYVKFMADLMTTPADISLLAKKRIIENNLGKDNEVLDLFNALKKGIGFLSIKDTYLSKTFDAVEDDYDNPSTQYLTDLRRNYCKNPWLILGVVVTTAGFIFSGLAAYFNLRDHRRSCRSCS